ncbi:hypothetical protein F2P81_003511 [Scophthalmus maximus]|uniref:Uncharacterized protein n=1 Tax=Scophthalmus maximus TaxID=52904 RepID=A0A6A4TEE9_SCOMX|nr:hypothetical protein F2P81_003511 [Scophthalmus maximus]
MAGLLLAVLQETSCSTYSSWSAAGGPVLSYCSTDPRITVSAHLQDEATFKPQSSGSCCPSADARCPSLGAPAPRPVGQRPRSVLSITAAPPITAQLAGRLTHTAPALPCSSSVRNQLARLILVDPVWADGEELLLLLLLPWFTQDVKNREIPDRLFYILVSKGWSQQGDGCLLDNRGKHGCDSDG